MTYSETTRIFVKDLIGSETCVTQSDGELTFKKIYEAFQRKEKVILSFSGIRFVISAFLNPALGMLYKYYDSKFLNENLSIVEITKDQKEMVREVMRNAKEYWNNEKEIKDNLKESIDENS